MATAPPKREDSHRRPTTSRPVWRAGAASTARRPSGGGSSFVDPGLRDRQGDGVEPHLRRRQFQRGVARCRGRSRSTPGFVLSPRSCSSRATGHHQGSGVQSRGPGRGIASPKVAYVQDVKSPLDGDSAVSENGHAALVDFNVAGDSIEAQDRIDPVLADVAAAQKRHPDLAVEQIGDASANKAINETIGDDLASAGMLSIPVTLILLDDHLRFARGRIGAAVDRAQRRHRGAWAGRTCQPDRARSTATWPR